MAVGVSEARPRWGWLLSSGWGISGASRSSTRTAPSTAFRPSHGLLLWAGRPRTTMRTSIRPLLPNWISGGPSMRPQSAATAPRDNT